MLALIWTCSALPAWAAASKNGAVHMNFFCKIDLFRQSYGRAHSDGKQDREILYKNNGFEGGGLGYCSPRAFGKAVPGEGGAGPPTPGTYMHIC